MAKLSVLVAPHPVLKRIAAPVEYIDNSIKQLIIDMMETMVEEEGIGLAAPQVGISKRIIVMDVPANIGADREIIENINPNPSVFKMINPEIIWKSSEEVVFSEGCLSVPGQFAPVRRAAEVKVQYLDENGIACQNHFKNVQSICVQHEIDHLNGILFIDYLSTLKRSMLIGRGKKFASKKLEEL